MSQNVFRGMEIAKSSVKVSIDTPDFDKQVEATDTVDVSEILQGRTIEELKEEKSKLEREVNDLDFKIKNKISDAERIAAEILENAKTEANRIIKKDNDRAQIIRQEANEEKDAILAQAREDAGNITRAANDEAEKIKKEAIKQGIEKGYRDGYDKESQEVKRLVERIQIILNASIEKRNEIFVETEQQIIGLVLLIAKKSY